MVIVRTMLIAFLKGFRPDNAAVIRVSQGMNARNQFVPPLSPNFNGRCGNDPRVTPPSYEIGRKGNVSCSPVKGENKKGYFSSYLRRVQRDWKFSFLWLESSRILVVNKNEGIRMEIWRIARCDVSRIRGIRVVIQNLGIFSCYINLESLHFYIRI